MLYTIAFLMVFGELVKLLVIGFTKGLKTTNNENYAIHKKNDSD